MSTLSKPLLDLELSLQASSSEAAWAIIRSFLRTYPAHAVQRDMWDILTGALTNHKVFHMQSAENRSQAILFYEHTVLLVKALQVALQHHDDFNKAFDEFDQKFQERNHRFEQQAARLPKIPSRSRRTKTTKPNIKEKLLN